MKIIKYNNYIKENLSYKTIFGKEVTHNEALQKRIRDLITQIVVDEVNISEKDFTRYDQVIENVKSICDDNVEIYEEAQNFYENKKRLNYLAEKIYDEYFKYNNINEKKSLEKDTDIKGKIERSHKIPKQLKDKIISLLSSNSSYDNGRVYNLKGFSSNGCSLGADKNGFFCYTHRARSKSYLDVDKIPQKDIKFIESTG